MKKVLAWAVALALVLSSFTMAFADTKTSADFSDASSIQYTEAVDVMVATGIINGYPDGTFGPQKTVKRSEMSKMIACIMNGGEDVGDQFKSACPFKDSQNHWAAGYIAYCASEHIIDGRSADVFDPEAEVTGTEVAKMALTSLGYDSKIQGYTGDQWAAAVLKDAKKNNLFKGLDSSFVPGDPCTREAAAQILFNMLKATEVEYNNNITVTTGEGTDVTVNSKPEQVKKDGETVELYEDVFGGDLVLKPATKDESGRPAHEWTYEKEKIGTYPDSAVDNITADESQSVADALKDINEDYKPGKVFVNGDEDAAATVKKGDIVETFETSTDNVYDVVITRYVLAKITDVDTNVTKSDVKKDSDLKAYVYINDKKYFDTKVANYDAASYVDDTYLAVAFNKAGDIMDSYIAETKQGELTVVTDEAFTVDGADYELSGSYSDYTFEPMVDENNVGDTIDVYFDSNEYILGAFEYESASEDLVAVVTGMKMNYYDYSVESNSYVESISLKDSEADSTAYSLTNAGQRAAYDELYMSELPVLVKYELSDNGKVKNVITADTRISTEEPYYDPDFGEITNREGEKINDKGFLGVTPLSKDVIAFYLDMPDATSDDDPEWIVYKYDELLDTTIPYESTYVLDGDGNIAYILLEDKIADDTANDVLGFFVDSSSKTDADGLKHTVNILKPDASSDSITTEGKKFAKDFFKNAKADTLYKFVKNKDDLATTVAPANLAPTTDPNGKWNTTDYSGYIYGTAAYTDFNTNSIAVTKVYSNKENILVTGANNPIYIADSTVFRVNLDEKKQIDSLSKMDASKIAEGGKIVLMQLNDESDGWDTILYMTKADADSLIQYSVTVNVEDPTMGTASADKATATVNDTVTITAEPEDGYELDAIVVTYADGTVTVTDNAFEMPAANVTVTVSFKAVASGDDNTTSGDDTTGGDDPANNG